MYLFCFLCCPNVHHADDFFGRASARSWRASFRAKRSNNSQAPWRQQPLKTRSQTDACVAPLKHGRRRSAHLQCLASRPIRTVSIACVHIHTSLYSLCMLSFIIVLYDVNSVLLIFTFDVIVLFYVRTVLVCWNKTSIKHVTYWSSSVWSFLSHHWVEI